MSNNELQYSGEFNLFECKLFTNGGNAIDLSTGNQILEIDIYEDIFKGGLTGSIFIADTHSLITTLPIVGHEGLSIKIQTPGFTEKNSSLDFIDRRMFVIYKIALRSELSQGAQVYQLKFASQELLISDRITVSKSYTSNISTMVKDVFTNEKYIGTKKKLFIEPTQGVRKIVVPNSHPYIFISRLAKESISTTGSPHYMFFENADGFHFRTLQDLYKQKSLGLFHYGENTKPYNNSHRTTAFEPKEETIIDLKRILQYELHNNTDMFYNSRSGMLSSTNIAHDIYNKEYVKIKYDYFNDFNKFQRISKTSNPKYSKKVNLEKYSGARFFLHPISTTGGNDANYSGNYASNKKDEPLFMDRQSRMFEINQGTSLTLTVAGNTAMRVGKTLMIDLPIIGVDHEDKRIDKYLSGNFMVQKIRHQFQIPLKTHHVHMELAKDCVETPVT